MRHVHGVATRDLLKRDDYGDDAIDELIRKGALFPMHRGVYRLAGAPPDYFRLVVGGLMAVGKPVAVTGRAALWIAGHLKEQPNGPPDLLVPYPRNPTRRTGLRIRATTRFEDCGLRRVDQLPVVSTGWAITDVARDENDQQLARLIATGVGGRWTSLKKLRLEFGARGQYPGGRRFRRVLHALETDMSYSQTERRLANRCRRRGHYVRLNQQVSTSAGVIVARADLSFPDRMVIVEVDGPHHWLPEVAAADRRRDRTLQLLGWTVLRFSVYEIDADLAGTVREIDQALRMAA